MTIGWKDVLEGIDLDSWDLIEGTTPANGSLDLRLRGPCKRVYVIGKRGMIERTLQERVV